ncbi:MAG: hypothetical protein JRN20_05620, partial [Nitrososphaerota archaeon]|nr:hypothetical protein [Nitrososphaerota archaeon]
EYLSRERRQSGAIMLREIHPGYILPVGVWNVRESIRSLFMGRYRSFDIFSKALDFACTNFMIHKRHWVENSELVKQEIEQRKISDY